DIYFPDDTSRHYYRIYDTPESEIGLDKYETQLLKSTLEKNDVKLLHFNSLNGKTLLVLEQKKNTEFSRQFYQVKQDTSLHQREKCNTLAGKYRSTSVKPSKTVVYLATDEKKIHEQFAPLFLNFPCNFTLLNFETHSSALLFSSRLAICWCECLDCRCAGGAVVKPAFKPKEYRKVEDCLSSTSAEIIFPSDFSYGTWERIRVQYLPDAVAFPTSLTQVQALVLCANAFQRKPVPRNGGPSYESFSSRNNSIVIDISYMVDVIIDEVAKKATVGAGIRLGPLYLQLDRKNFTFIVGTCPTVGLTGIIAAGLGGGGRSYGIVTQWTLSLIPAWQQNTVFQIKYPIKSAQQGLKLCASDQLKTILDASGLRNLDGKPSNEMYKETNNLVGIISDYSPGPKQRRALEKQKQCFLMSLSPWSKPKLLKSCLGDDAYAEFDVYGGIFSKQPSNLTAFVHRSNTKIGAQLCVFLTGDTKEGKELLDWIKPWDTKVRTFSNGLSYQ
ncbi:7530_t:CDS:2, partial [Ambispora gerdemannii]